ncbi:MAG TPA: hypothetical protein VFS81_14450 [Candidatus Binatia bacterium]|nr:hypothetical protein [Candidatus Binatia bacterium]
MLAQRKLAIVGHSAAASGTARRQTVRQHVSWFLDLRVGKIVKTFAFFDSVAFNELWERVKPYSRIRQVSLIKAYCVAACGGVGAR